MDLVVQAENAASSRVKHRSSWLARVEEEIRFRSRPVRDFIENRRRASASERILLVRHRTCRPNYYRQFLDWVERRWPEQRSKFELASLPLGRADRRHYRLAIPWIPDEVLTPDSREWEWLSAAECELRAVGIPVINPLVAQARCTKLEGSQYLREAGFRSPLMSPIENLAEFRETLFGWRLPILVRDNFAHAGHLPIFLLETADDARRLPLDCLPNPVAVEFIDVRNPHDGLCRRYRYIAFGDHGVATNLHISKNWEVRGRHRETNAQTRDEELAYVSKPDPHHEGFQRVRAALGLDFVGFDYSWTPDGELIVWEANVLPGLDDPRDSRRAYLAETVERLYSALLEFYLSQAGVDVPHELVECARSLPTVRQAA